jgi:hypothetical protein
MKPENGNRKPERRGEPTITSPEFYRVPEVPNREAFFERVCRESALSVITTPARRRFLSIRPRDHQNGTDFSHGVQQGHEGEPRQEQ